MAPEPASPSASSVLLPVLGSRQRAPSLTSLNPKKGNVDKDILAQALDSIHTTASQSATLTSFHDYDGGAPRNSPKEVVSSGISGFYDRYVRGISTGTPSRETTSRPKSSASKHSQEMKPSPNAKSRSSNVAGKDTAIGDAASIRSADSTAARSTTEDAKIVRDAPSVTTGSREDAVRRTERPTHLTLEPAMPDGKERKRVKSAQQVVRKTSMEPDEDLFRNASVAVGHGETAAEALARVLSQHENSSADDARPSLSRASSQNTVDRPRVENSPHSSVAPTTDGTNNGTIQFADTTGGDSTQKPLQRPRLSHVGISHLPGYVISREPSTDGGDAASFSSSQQSIARPTLGPSPNLNSALQRQRSGMRTMSYDQQPMEKISQHFKRRVISKAFWMKDENAKDCFYCGESFSTFRRKHHCRTCGQIFDAKCTNLVPGRIFGHPGTIRLCKPCEAMMYGSDDDSTVFSDDASEFLHTPRSRRMTMEEDEASENFDAREEDENELAEVMTPSIGIPASRRNREAKRRSAVIEFDAPAPLARPTSSHSLISLARRPRSSSHRRHNSRHQNIRGARTPADERVPFHPGSVGSMEKGSGLPAFHNDNIIDPDLAAFVSDEGSDEDDRPSMVSMMGDHNNMSVLQRERMGLSASGPVNRKGRSRHGTTSSVKLLKEDDSVTPPTPHLPKLSRTRNLSSGSLSFSRASPRRSKSNHLLKQVVDPEALDTRVETASITSAPSEGVRIVRSSAMHGSDAPPVELNQASLEHVRRLLVQMLHDNHITPRKPWEKALLPIFLQCTDDVQPNVQVGDDMDIRHYIKLKKVPGGKPGDTSYISGIVFSKNVALKSMARSISDARIAIVTFAIEYARHQTHFMSLDPVIAQEQEYLRNLVGRIAALRPKVLLVQRNVSGSALHLLEKAGITVVYNIKESVLNAVARVTQTTMIKSVDKLAIDPSHLGICDCFNVKTYVHEGVRKSYIFLSGCQPDLGCTVVLRGSDAKTLRKIKRITEFMCYVTYSLKLETNLLRDEFVSIPVSAPGQLEAPDSPHQTKALHRSIGPMFGHGESKGDPDVRTRIGGENPSRYEKLELEARSRILSASPFVVFMQPYLLTQLRESEKRLTTYKLLRDQYAAADEEGDADEKREEEYFELVKPEMVHAPPSKAQPKAVRDYLHAVHEAQLEKTMHTYETQKRLMDAFMSGGVNPLDPYSHQTIVVLQSTVSTINSAPCVGPELLGIGFYASYNRVEPDFEEDCTLGQYVEDHCLSANSACKECGKKMYDHHRQYVHGYGQLSISVKRQPAKMRGYQKTILMWATCRICKQETTVTPMSDNTWKYSFAKYLELSFWSSPLHPRAGVCEHDIHKDFLRCFGFEELVVCVQYDPVDIYDIVVPRSTITWKVESDLKVKNTQFLRFVKRLNAFTESVKKRLDSINVDVLDEKKAAEAHDLLDELRRKAEEEHKQLLQKLQAKYAQSRYYELIPLNRALRLIDEKAIAWDEIFSDFERDYFPSETDIRKLATLQLKNMFLESQPPASTLVSDASDSDDGSEQPSTQYRRLTRGLTEPVFPPEKVHDVLSSTVEKHRNSIVEDDDPLSEIKTNQAEGAERAEITPQISREEQVQAVEHDDVKHLDLAVASESPQSPKGDITPTPDERFEQSSEQGNSSPIPVAGPFATQAKTVGAGLMERIEQIRNIKMGAQPEPEGLGSRIPRLVDLRKQDTNARPGPPSLLRTQSSPSSPKHMHQRSMDSEHSIDAVVSATTSQETQPNEKHIGERLGVTRLASKVGKLAPSLIPRSIPGYTEDSHSTKVSALAKHFEQMSKEFERERLKERKQRALRSRQARANPLASSRPVVEVYKNATDAVGERNIEHVRAEQTQKPSNHSRMASVEEPLETQVLSSDEIRPEKTEETKEPDTTARQDYAGITIDAEGTGEQSDSEPSFIQSRDASDPAEALASGLASPVSAEMDFGPELTIPDHKKSVWFKYLAEFWSKRTSSGWSSLEYPLYVTEHIFEDSDIIVREDEPSSVIALSLACADYQNKAQEFRSHPKKQSKLSARTHMQLDEGIDESPQQRAIEASLLSDTGTHMKYSFAHGQVKASCKIFYAEAFDALRRRCGVSERFVESMSRCLKFDSKGGKTKSLFLKTLDNRFYIKSLQEVELKAFTKFAPDYFAFMSHTLFHGVPSVIAKMFGLFQVIIKNPATGMDFSYYLLVMENLFYERSPNRRFDLKGSMRNRKIESTGQPDEVLLDENLVETIFESPLFVREHARKLLQASVWNDTMWLCKQNVMDYSLMAGFDDEKKELIVGIIDCIRTYTWDKKLESWIKDRGKNKPTITSPKDYRNRFRVSMMQYVLQAPNCWHQFQTQMPMPKTLKERYQEREDGIDGAEELQ